jgi:hypothetical protein
MDNNSIGGPAIASFALAIICLVLAYFVFGLTRDSNEEAEVIVPDTAETVQQ